MRLFIFQKKSKLVDRANSSETLFTPSLLNYFPVKNHLNV